MFGTNLAQIVKAGKGTPAARMTYSWESEEMPKGRLELPWLAPPPPQDGVSTNSTTSALGFTTKTQSTQS